LNVEIIFLESFNRRFNVLSLVNKDRYFAFLFPRRDRSRPLRFRAGGDGSVEF
jgi:hypothetical protein